MDYSTEDLIKKITAQEYAAIARIITLIENNSAQAKQVLDALSKQKHSKIIGITGPPGSGKSTMVDKIALKLKDANNSVAIVAVDPSSVFTHGAVLGDRIRMSEAASADIFIRSIATRGALGGLSAAIQNILKALNAAGFDYIIIETVGVGQAEIDIVKVADTTLVTLIPGLGDMVQAFKAGVLEIADIFVLNKSDHPGVDQLEKELITLVSLDSKNLDNWETPITRTIATTGEGVDKLIEHIKAHQQL